MAESKSRRMGDSLDNFQRYLGNSPFRLGMISFERCGTGKQKRNDNAVEHKESKKVRSVPGKKKAPLSPFNHQKELFHPVLLELPIGITMSFRSG